jgi:UDP-2,4-diacetamido-2,4,6-trideoxy-beta-L-altropyranose hydrolase
MNVFIITEGGSLIGSGHITRCISIYDAFRERHISPTFVINGDEAGLRFLRGYKKVVFNWLEEKERLLNLINNADIAVVDSYLADASFYNHISDIVRVPVYIDDTMRIDYPRGIVVNGTIYAEKFNYPKKKNVTYLLGSKYIPLRKEFRDMPEKENKEKIKTVMITFGGEDIRNLTPDVLKIISDNFPEYSKLVIIGSCFKNIELIKSVKDKNTSLIYSPYANKMKETMLRSDIAISAGGQTLYELARVGVPTVAIAADDNQMNNIIGWEKTGFIEYAGWWDDKKVFKNLLRKINVLSKTKIRGKKKIAGRRRVDSLGASRVVTHCIKQFFRESIIVRNAATSDLHLIYQLSNDPEVRKNSFSKGNIDIKTHRKWFYNKLKDPDCIYLISECSNNFMGQVRFDKEGEKAIISISIVRRYRHLGAGMFIMKKALLYLKKHYPEISKAFAFVKEENTASKKFFESLGFLFSGRTKIKNQCALEYSLSLENYLAYG